MNIKFENLNPNAQKDFVLKYYPLIFRRQQEEDQLSKLEFLQRYLMIKGNSKSGLNGKLLISKSAYKRYLKIVKDIYTIRFKSKETGHISRSSIEPFYSKLNIPKLHEKKHGFELSAEILSRFDKDIIEEIWEQVNLDSVWDNMIIGARKEQEKRIKLITHLLQESGLLDVVFQTLTNVIDDNIEVEEVDSGTLTHMNFILGNSHDSSIFKNNGNLFLRELKKELQLYYEKMKDAEDELDRGLELHYSHLFEHLDLFDEE
ncbi:hypothetical protein K6V43_08410 [Streptococcus suis]|nr:hypothetical protein [Streptococcus suis]